VTKLCSTNGVFISTQTFPQYFKQLYIDNVEWTSLLHFSAVLYLASLYYTLQVASKGTRTLIINTWGMGVCLMWVLCVVQVEVSATSWSLVQRNPTDCGASLCVIYKTRESGGHGPLGAVVPNQIINRMTTDKEKESTPTETCFSTTFS